MRIRSLLIALLATSLLLIGGAGAVAADGAPEAQQDDGPHDDAYANSQSAVTDGDTTGMDGDRGLPDDLPEAVGHALILLGHLLDGLPPALDETLIGLV